jgi:hypothetical protein
VVLTIASLGTAEEPLVSCGICGFVLDESRECPRCKLIRAEMGRELLQPEPAPELFTRTPSILAAEEVLVHNI